MQENDTAGFERAFKRLCAAFDSPPTEARKDAYWRSFRKLQLLEFTGLIDMALVESTFASMPTVGALWELHRKVQSPLSTGIPTNGPTLQEQLCQFVLRKMGSQLTPKEITGPWTYVYREWRDGDKRCAECTGVIIERENGARLGFKIADMKAEEFELA